MEFENICQISVSYLVLIIRAYVFFRFVLSNMALYGYLAPLVSGSFAVLNFASYIQLYLACVPRLVICVVLLYVVLSCMSACYPS